MKTVSASEKTDLKPMPLYPVFSESFFFVLSPILEILSTSFDEKGFPEWRKSKFSFKVFSLTLTIIPFSGWSSAFWRSSKTNRSVSVYKSPIIAWRAFDMFFASRSVDPVSSKIFLMSFSFSNLSLYFTEGNPTIVFAIVNVKGFFSRYFLSASLTLICQ